MAKTSPTISIRIGDRDYDKPYDPGCRACTSPWALQIDHWLAAGYPAAWIQQQLAQRRSKLPVPVLTGHVPHLAPPHLADRERLAPGGKEGDGPAASLGAVNSVLIRRAFEALVNGDESMAELAPRDLLQALKLQLQIDREEEARARGTAEEWQQAFAEFFSIARAHLGEAFGPFLRDVYASQAISRMTGRPAAPGLLQLTAQGPQAVDDEVVSTR